MDRNPKLHQALSHVRWSLSARRAWIEILVAITPSNFSKSLSARRAWIEILTFPGFGMEIDVALRKESVDRNYCCWRPRYSRYWSLSARRAWIEIFSD